MSGSEEFAPALPMTGIWPLRAIGETASGAILSAPEPPPMLHGQFRKPCIYYEYTSLGKVDKHAASNPEVGQ